MRHGDQRRRFQTDGMQSVSPERLVILLYERAGRDVAEARRAIVEPDAEIRHRMLLHAQEIVEELAYAIDIEVWPDGDALLSIYEYILELLVRANIETDLVALDEATALLTDLTTAWRDAYVSLQSETAIA
jgi:flagellar secretion chaperone FliS